MKKYFIFLIGVVLVITSCKNHLSKKDAKKQIILSGRFPKAKEYQFTKSFSKDYNTNGNGLTIILDEDEFKTEQKKIEDFEKKKLVQFEEIPQREETTQWLLGTTIRTWTMVKISLTEEGKKYLIRENDGKYIVKLWDENVSEITGMREYKEGQEKRASASYLIVNEKVTPFGECFDDKNSKYQSSVTFSFKKRKWVL